MVQMKSTSACAAVKLRPVPATFFHLLLRKTTVRTRPLAGMAALLLAGTLLSGWAARGVLSRAHRLPSVPQHCAWLRPPPAHAG